MENDLQPENYSKPTNDPEEISIFDNFGALPKLYSKQAIFLFTLLGGSIFGGVLMCMNCHQIANKKGITSIVIFIISVILVTRLFVTLSATYLAGIYAYLPMLIGYIINFGIANLYQFQYWDRYIGRFTMYKKRSTLVPGIILGLLLLVTLYVLFAPYILGSWLARFS